MEKIEELIALRVDEASLVSNIWIEVGIWRKQLLQDEEGGGQDEGQAPATHGVDEEPGAMGSVAPNCIL